MIWKYWCCKTNVCENVCENVYENAKDMKVDLKRRENFDVIENLQVVCCDVLKNVKRDFEIVIINVKIDIDKIDFEIVCKNMIDAIDVSFETKVDAIIVVKISNLNFFAWCFSTCLCNFVLLKN